ncbi:MAG TPA: hypothetical protein VNB90_13790 [Cytophagaceae bacterium]|jgi:hypothetical protein|nr:hypothetical protein [Cytophagaceae bacterium]
MKSFILLAFSSLLFSFVFYKKATLPPTNEKVLEYVNSVLGKKVGAGECWDLANEALTHAHAKWTFPTTFGKPYNYKKDTILPGDVIQLSDVTIETRSGNSISRITMAKHTAIVYSVGTEGKIKVAEQNFNNLKKIVINEWDLDDVKKGKLQFYRPQPL